MGIREVTSLKIIPFKKGRFMKPTIKGFASEIISKE